MQTIDSEEDLEFIHKMLIELSRQFDICQDTFSYERDYYYEQSEEEALNERVFNRKYFLKIRWEPEKSPNNIWQNIEKIKIEYAPTDGDISFYFAYLGEDPRYPNIKDSRMTLSSHYNVGFQANKRHMALKITFFKLYDKIAHYQDVQRIKNQRAKVINVVCDLFPQIMDSILLGENDDKKKE